MLNPISIASSPATTLPQQFLFPKSSFNGLRLRLPLRFPISISVSTPKTRSSSVVNMAKREEELKDIRAKTTEEINEEIIDLKGDLLMLRLLKSNRNEFKASEFGRMRKREQNPMLFLTGPNYI